MFQSDDGALWFATLDGVSRFDGTWQTFTVENTGGGLAHNNIHAITQSSDGAMWFGCGFTNDFGDDVGGASRYDGLNWITFTERDGLAGNDVLAVTEASDGAMWFGTTDGATRRADGVWESFHSFNSGVPPFAVSQIYETSDGALWFMGDGRGIGRFNGQDWGGIPPLPESIASQLVISPVTIYEATDGSIWFGHIGKVVRLLGTEYELFTELPWFLITSISESADGSIWVTSGTDFDGVRGGLSRFDDDAWVHFNVDDGLAANHARSVIESTDGALWIGTIDGVTRYTGPLWTSFGGGQTPEVAGDFSWLYHTSDGDVWAGPAGSVRGVSRFDGESWQPFDVPQVVDQRRGITTMFRAVDGSLWFGENGFGESAVSHYRDGDWATYQPSKPVGPVVEAYASSDGSIWFLNRPDRVFRFADGQLRQFHFEFAGLPEVVQSIITGVNFTVHSVHQSIDGATWFGTSLGVLRHEGGIWTSLHSEDGIPSQPVTAIHQSSNGTMWFGSDGGGITRWDESEWERFTTDDGLPGDHISTILQSDDGLIWVGTTSGVGQYDGEVWRLPEVGFFGSSAQSILNVTDIIQISTGEMWFATTVGILRNATEELYDADDGLGADYVYDIEEASDGTIWAGTTAGVSRFDGQTWSEPRFAFVKGIAESADGTIWLGLDADPSIRRLVGDSWPGVQRADGLAGSEAIFQSADGAMWFGGALGASRLWNGEFRTYSQNELSSDTTREFFLFGTVSEITQTADGAIWFGGSGLSRFQHGRFTPVLDQSVNALHITRGGDLWVGTFGDGAWKLDAGRWETITQADGLLSDDVRSIAEGEDGAIWLGTVRGGQLEFEGIETSSGRSGVTRYDGQTLQHFTERDGLISNQVFSVLQGPDGRMWFGTDEGISVFNRPTGGILQTRIVRRPPSPLGEGRFLVEGRGFDAGTNDFPPLAHALTSEDRLPGEAEWSSFQHASSFEITGFGNGSWTVWMRAQDRYGNPDATPASFTFVADLTGPTAAITSPRTGDVVSGDVDLIGVAIDRSETPDLEIYQLEYAPGTSDELTDEWQPVDAAQSNPVSSGVLGTWRTDELDDGPYVVRLSARDRLGHLSDHLVDVTLVSALGAIDDEAGGVVSEAGGQVALMIPPNGLASDATVEVAIVTLDALPPMPVDAMSFEAAYSIGPSEVVFAKRSTLTIDLLGSRETNGSILAVYRLGPAGWERLGGTVSDRDDVISVGIDEPGIFALFQALPATGQRGIANVVCQPRVISPGGQLYPGTTDISFELGTSSAVDVNIYGLSGFLVRRVLESRLLSGGLNTVRWDGIDRSGNVVRDGLYIVVIQAEGVSANKTVAVVNR